MSSIHPQNIRGEYDDTLASRFTSPIAGSFSYYTGQLFVAERDIDAGEELFANYGEEWLDAWPGEDGMPRRADFEKAGDVMMRLARRRAAGDKKGSYGGQNEKEDVMKLLKSAVSVLNERAASVLPTSAAEVLDPVSHRPATDNDDDDSSTAKRLEKRLAYRSTNVRDISWIETHGKCLDNLVPRPSTLPLHAGQGAFAQRKINEGELIVPVPLLVICDPDGLDMHATYRNKETGRMERGGNDEVVGKQLILNYCFGHWESTVLLCPTTNAVLINHCSSRTGMSRCGGEEGPNAKVRWADWDDTNDTWREASLEEVKRWTEDGHRGLSMEVVALRDIRPGEEVFIDYGPDWENAFARHVDNWAPPPKHGGFDNYTPVKAMNDSDLEFRTVAEQKHDPYPDNVATACFKITDNFDDAGYEEYYGRYTNDDEILEIDLDDPGLVITSDEHHTFSKWGWHWPCRVLENEGDGRYAVRILAPLVPEEEREGWVKNKQVRILMNYPGTLIKFIHKSYTSDQFLPGAFRHHIGIHDDMFPRQWKDLARG